MQVFTQMFVVVALLKIKYVGVQLTFKSFVLQFFLFRHLSHSQHLLRSRPYLVNLLPCFIAIAKRQEETVQETLAAAMPKIMAALGNFANDSEIKVSMLPMLKLKISGSLVLGNLLSLLCCFKLFFLKGH